MTVPAAESACGEVASVRRSDAIRIGISGSAGVGKTTLAVDLGEALGLPVIEEEMRCYLENGGSALADLTPARAAGVVRELWSDRRARERSLDGFVADNSSVEFAAYALACGCLDDETNQAQTDSLLKDPLESIASYDAVIVLPYGALPYEEDGVRSSSRVRELRHQVLVEGLLRQSLSPDRVLFMPVNLTDRAGRVAFAMRALNSLIPNVVARVGPACSIAANGGHGFDAEPGRVYLVGAGPGDPKLLTQRALELLESVDVVAYDKLVPREILELVPDDVELLCVGHRGRGSSKASWNLHPAVLERAMSGQDVVRLKIGDPSVFGRSGEENEVLAANGVSVEIVPGISAALGAAASTGIPLTHRSCASDVTFVTGHEPGSGRPSQTDWQGLGRSRGTLVLFMAAHRLASTADRLIANGRDPLTPAAYVAAATRPDEQVVIATLSTLAEAVGAIDRSRPALVLVGEVVGLATTPVSRGAPLRGRRVLVARARPGPSAIADRLRRLGAHVFECPEIEVEPIALGPGDREKIRSADRVLFGCRESVRSVLRREPGAVVVGREHLVGVGPKAATELRSVGHECVELPGSCEEAVDTLMTTLAGASRAVGLVGDAGRPALQSALERRAADVSWISTYRTHTVYPRLALESIHAVVVPSSSAARHIFDHPIGATLMDAPVVAIGPKSGAEARRLGARRVAVAARDTVDEVIRVASGILERSKPEVMK